MKGSNHLPLYFGGFAVIAFALGAPSARAQEAGRDVCQAVGNHAPEPLGDRQGHAMETELDSCRTTEGLMAGAVMNASAIWEWDGAKATLLSSQGTSRKPGATVAFQGIDGKVELMMSNGKVTGSTASGHTLITLATGDAAPLQGKTAAWTAKSTGPDSFELEYIFK